ncbi:MULTISPECIES: phosphotransferase [unclassified Gordonia (in: high G+C Gram-positive bacteria)]|uniref:phosphotransferase n=1 Tax=unclassified Gordonia (in: high G+C Gram-positive bacteria) TaxID=2657482 RepID=UPI001F0FBE41|nr:phosphotransferase [Gordonia sp. ABSL49_1]MCH5643547.1 phosphotransferase [Gordonia sp. ABSL49_1]
MTVLTESRIMSVVRAAEALLSHRAGSAVVLDDPEDLGGSGRTTVVRVRVAQNPLSLDRSLVIKALPEHEDPHAFHREIASYKYATALPNESRPGPQLIASDSDIRLMVLSDLGHGKSMTSLLSGVDPVETSRAVSAWGQALGRMHAATVGGEGDFLALLRRGPSGADKHDIVRDTARRAVSEVGRDTALIDVDLPDPVVAALRSASDLFDEGDHRAFSPSDVGPENILLNEDGVQFMDYEWGGFRDSTLDIAYALVTFTAQLGPSGVARATDLEVSMVDAWRSEVMGIWPALGHEREMQHKVLIARLLWVWLSTVWMLPGEVSISDPGYAHDWALHTNDPRVIVARWTDLAAAAGRGGDEAIAAFSVAVGSALQRTWLS